MPLKCLQHPLPSPYGADGTARALHISGTAPQTWIWAINRWIGCTSTEGYAGIEFWAKGDVGPGNSLKLLIGAADGISTGKGGDCIDGAAGQCGLPSTTVAVSSDEWTHHRIPFDSLSQPDPSKYQLVEWNDYIMQIQLQYGASSRQDIAVNFWLDEMKFYTE